jgi:hypothetical protein
LCLIVDCLLFYGRYKYNIFPEKLAKEIDYYDVFNFKGVKKLVFDISSRIFLISFVIYAMFRPPHEWKVIPLGLLYCFYVMHLAYKVLRPYFTENKT